jgi:hypothetical protein
MLLFDYMGSVRLYLRLSWIGREFGPCPKGEPNRRCLLKSAALVGGPVFFVAVLCAKINNEF